MNLRLATAVIVTAVLAAACSDKAAAPPLVTTTVAADDVPAPTTTPAGTLAPAAITQVDCPSTIAADTVACGIAEVVLNPATGSDATASISIATMAGYDVGFRTPVAVLQGGPGGASSDLAGFFPQQPFTQVFVDQRGTGFTSADFDCPEFDDVIPELVERDGERSRELAADALDACAERLAGDLLLDATKSQNHAFDVGQVMAGLGYDRWVAYGVSYGTTIGFELLRQSPAALVGTVLDGVYPPDLDVDTSVAATAQGSIDALGAACARSTRCTDLNPDVALGLDALIAKLDESPRIVTLSPNESGFDREVDVQLDGARLAEFVFLLLYNESLFRYLPATLAGIADGDPNAERWLARVGTRSFASAYKANREGTYFAVQCHDRLPFSSGEPVERDGGFGAAVPVEPLRNLCPAWEQGEARAIFGTPVSSDLPTLLLSGTLDPITPSTFADAAADLLPNATTVTQDGRGHGIWFGNSCIAGIVQQFVADPLRTLDTSCADASVPIDWAAP